MRKPDKNIAGKKEFYTARWRIIRWETPLISGLGNQYALL
jgi:hypothetical protein